ncbi:c-type cytochrome [Rhodopirellula sp. SWK7]|uniref:c-type cytochrome n=1 Tax=Rhodopirellula sp. SWK7 TaxID=595460 RepID=UPI0002BFB69D|nr:c-type cytochrome [Rhodopirellula sp. SWK7]EMI41534.1 class I triheme cytochrome c [Rhodopirellula sp. SWK7]
MMRRLKELATLLTAIGILGVIVLVSGIVPIKASSGHWPITRWTLDFASDRSVGLHSTGIDVPPLDEPGMVQLGSATFDSNCRWCHGAPGFPHPPVAAQMTPHPPDLSEAASQWDDAELFYIVKHGIKFAGMPAWPTQARDDDIWPVVAFLRELPSIDAREYLAWVQPGADETEGREPAGVAERESSGNIAGSILRPTTHIIAMSCAACHGLTGNESVNDQVPVLASQSETYLKRSLRAYRSGRRYSGVMMPIAHRLTDQQIDELASYFAEQPRRAADDTNAFDEELIDTGRRLANQGDQTAKIASCVDCHGPGENVRSDEYPKLAGQSVRYLKRQLELFVARDRGGSDNASLMHSIADKLSEKQRTALSAYYESINEDSEE